MRWPALVAALLLAAQATAGAPPPGWQDWPTRRFVLTPAPCLSQDALVGRLRALQARHGGRLALEEVGRSVEGRVIHLLSLGHGARHVLLWSQMHGDEPSATPALVDVADTLLDSDPDGVLDRLTLLMVPMLNPDGAERHVRRNAQGIDVNRDALSLATPEGRLLKALRERFQPELGFYLHDQARRPPVGDTGVLATISLLAVAGDPQGTLTVGRSRAKRVCACVARTLEGLLPGGVARYDEDWSPRAFGDNLTAWGTPVVLIESGGVPAGLELTDLTRLNYVALLAVLRGLARDDLAGESPERYESLKRNGPSPLVDVLLAGGRVAQPTAPEPYAADVAFDVPADDSSGAGCAVAAPAAPSRIRELGDGRLLTARRRIDAAGRLIVPAFTASVRGFSARGWLDAPTLGAIGQLGVGRVLWHVAEGEYLRARDLAHGLAGEGRPLVEVVGADVPAVPLVVAQPPLAPAGPRLAETLDALTSGSWRRAVAGRSAAALLGDLAGVPAAGPPATPLLAPDRAATLLVLRPSAHDAGAPGFDPARLEVEAVFIDGRRPVAR